MKVRPTSKKNGSSKGSVEAVLRMRSTVSFSVPESIVCFPSTPPLIEVIEQYVPVRLYNKNFAQNIPLTNWMIPGRICVVILIFSNVKWESHKKLQTYH